MLIDLDPQSNATLSFVDQRGLDVTVYDLLLDPTVTAQRAIATTEYQNLDVLGSRISLAKAESKLIGEFDSHYKLKDKLEFFKHTLLEKKAVKLIIDSSTIEEVEPSDQPPSEEKKAS